ncbi:MAG TPA: FecR family protein, partial [Spirochaetota bacterium]|nr:FecR family protein [Spirochaetota bacterium]
MRYFNSNFLVLVAGTAIIATFSTLFYLDVNRRIDAGDARVIGSITFKKRVAQRKYSRQVVWEDLQQTEPIYNNDTIRTGEKSEAVVKINDGSEFTLNENSMVLVSMGGDQLDIEFNQGSITANRDNVTGDDIKKLNIKTGGTTVSIDRSSVNISKEKGEELNLVVNKGDAVVKTGNVEKTVSVDQKAVVLLQSAQVSVVNQPIVLLSPSHDQYFVTGGDR